MTLRALFSKKWILPGILVIVGMILLARLGIWQLDRLQQKRDFNELMATRWRMEPYDLNTNALPEDLRELEYRRVQATGAFDYGNQILITNMAWAGTAGAVVVTPLVLDGDNGAVLVARGWIPYDQIAKETWPEFEEPPGEPVLGLVRKTQALPNGATATPPPAPQTEWYRIDIPNIQAQMPYPLQPAYIEMLPESGRTVNDLPIRQEPTPLDDGNHLSYAIQWFTFALILGFGYIMLVRYQTRRAAGLMKPTDQEPITTDA